MIELFGIIAVVVGVGPDTQLELHRCADAKAQNPALLAVVAVVSSLIREFGLRSELRRTQFQDAKSIDSRNVFRPSNAVTGIISTEAIDDNRPVCVQPIFVLSPWRELSNMSGNFSQLITRQDEWRKVIAESKEHHDVLIAPTIIDRHTQARELMHVLEWSRHRAPWADYIVSANTSMRMHWARMIELFPPPVPQNILRQKLWMLGSSSSSIDALFFNESLNGVWRQCGDVGVAAFSRDLVRKITDISLAAQLLYALRYPLQMHQARCKHRTLGSTRMPAGVLARIHLTPAMFGRITGCPCPHKKYPSQAE